MRNAAVASLSVFLMPLSSPPPQRRRELQHLPIHKKVSQTKRIATRQTLVEEEAAQLTHAPPPSAHRGVIAAAEADGQDRVRENEDLASFISKKREMFLLQYSLGVKREEMRKLEEQKQSREGALRKKENLLEEDAARFDRFLRDNDAKAHAAMKRAEKETKLKVEKQQEITRLNAAIATVQSEIAKSQDQLDACFKYKQFLDSLTPPDWFEEQRAARLRAKEARQAAEEEDDEGSDEDDIPMFFVEPQQLLDKFAELEERNLFLIQNTQETEEALEDLRSKYTRTREKKLTTIQSLDEQIAKLTTDIAIQDEKARKLEDYTREFAMAADADGNGVADQDEVLAELHQAVFQVYSRCFEGEELSHAPTTLDMLTHLEAELDRRLELIDLMAHERGESEVKELEKKNDQRRREEARLHRNQEKAQSQELRMQRALERAKAPVKKKTGKPVMFRSAPATMRRRQKEDDEKANEEEEERRLFFER